MTSLSRLGLGCGRMGSFNNPASAADSRRLVAAALDLGVSVIDTANIYGQGDSERIIGRALAGKRDRAFLMTKIGKGFSARMRLLRPLKPLIKPLIGRKGQQQVSAARAANMDPDFPRSGYTGLLDQSLGRLRTDHVDALFLHSPPGAVCRDEGARAELLALKQAGKARHVGISCDHEDELDAALAIDGLDILQLPFDMILARTDTVAEARARGIIVIAREVIAYQPGLSPAEAVRTAAHHPAVDCALVGTTSRAHLAEAAAAVA